MPESDFDPGTERFLRRIQTIYPELPRLLGQEWPAFQQELYRLLLLYEQPDWPAPVVEQNVRQLLRSHPRVNRYWQDNTPRGGSAGYQSKGFDLASLLANFSPGEKAATRYTDLRCPAQAALGREFQVTVRLTLRPHAESRDAQKLSALTGRPLLVEIGGEGVFPTEGSTRSLDIPDDRDSDWAVFGLRAARSGPVEVRLRFFQNGNLLGQARCRVLVVEQAVDLPARQQPALPLAFDPDATPPKRILCISLRGERLHYSLYIDGAAADAPLPPVDLLTNPVSYTRRLFSRLSRLAHAASASPFDAAAAVEEVAQMGYLLWDSLIPHDLKTRWLDERSDWAQEPLLIVSDEAYIPWELVRSNQSKEHLAWGVHGPMSRWLGVDEMHPARSGPAARLTLRPWAGLFPADSDLSHLAAEAALVRGLLAGDGERTPTPLGRRAVLELLAAGECGWLHAVTHGLLDPSGEGEGASLLLEKGELLEPEALVGPAVRTGLQKSRPGVFWNLCHGAAAGWTLTGVGGWAGRLIDGGASLFLAPQWTVTDRAARRFAESFYTGLAASDAAGVAVAAQQARLAAQDETGDPSWLAYALYAHPNARAGA